jgi:transposase
MNPKTGQWRKGASPKCGKVRGTEGEETMQKRNHSRDLKLEVVHLLATGEKRPAQICREYSLAESVLSRWRKEYQEKGEAAFQGENSKAVTTQEQKIAELERFCGQLALENQILKKTLQNMGSKSAIV